MFRNARNPRTAGSMCYAAEVSLSPYWELRIGSDYIVWLLRLDLRYPSLEAVEAFYVSLLAQLDELPDGPLAHVADLRASPPGNNDAGFEALHQKYRPEIFSRFVANVLLVRTAAGRMQLHRMRRQGEGDFLITDGPDDAIRFCQDALTRAGRIV